MNQHTIKRFEDELNELKEKILIMGGLVEKATKRSMNSLIKQDTTRAHKVIDREVDINTLELEIDEMTRTILALRQPAASDLRFVMTTIKIVTDLERMGDLAEGIAENMLQTEDHPLIQIDSLQNLYKLVLAQLTLVLDAFARNDLDSAVTCIQGDKAINKMYKAMQREHLTYMVEDPRQITSLLIASTIAKKLERIGDHVVTIAEMIIYMINGQDIRHNKALKQALIAEADNNN